MKLNLLVKEDALSFHYGHIAKLIQSLRKQHQRDGGDATEFPKYLEEAGVRMDGPFVVVTDEFELMACLKYSDREE